MTDDLYDVLEIDKSATASEIKKAYRKMVKEHHPDKGGDEDEFKKVSYAYEVLSSDDKKRIYDARGHDGLNHQGPNHDFNDTFGQFVRQQQQRQQMSRSSIRVKLSLTLEEVFKGKESKFHYNRVVECHSCGGQGGSNPKVCHSCGGQGRVAQTFQTPQGYMQQVTSCPDCNGQGTTFESICNVCHGNGTHSTRETFEIKIPHGYLTGQTIVEQGKGSIMGNGEYGDLIMMIEVKPHDRFKILSDFDLISTLTIPYEIFVLGGKVEFTTIDKKIVKLSVPKLSKVGNRLKLSKMGLKKVNMGATRGDQYLALDIVLPTLISDEEKELLERIKKIKE